MRNPSVTLEGLISFSLIGAQPPVLTAAGKSGRRDNVTAHIDDLLRAIGPVPTACENRDVRRGIGRIPILCENILAGFIPIALYVAPVRK